MSTRLLTALCGAALLGLASAASAAPSTPGPNFTLHHAGEPRLQLTEKYWSLEPAYRHVGGVTRLSDEALFGAEGPRWTDVKQGRLGDCYFMAALGRLATQPNRVTELFARKPDGSLDVDANGFAKVGFYRRDPKSGEMVRELVTVSSLVAMGNLGKPLFAKVIHDKLWVAAVEKAYMKWLTEHDLNPRDKPVGPGERGWDRGGHGGEPGEALEALTGKPVEIFHMQRRSSEADVYQKLHAALDAGKLVVASSAASRRAAERRWASRFGADGVRPFEHKMAYDHAYGVQEVFEREEGGATKRFVRLHNPWRRHPFIADSKHGSFVLPMDEFLALCRRVTIAG